MLLIKLLDGQLDKLRIIEAKARAKNREFLNVRAVMRGF